MDTRTILLALVLLLVSGMASVAFAQPTIVAGQAKAIAVELTNNKDVAETLDLSVDNSNPGVIAEAEQKSLTLQAHETKTVNVLVKPSAEAREGTYLVTLVGKKMITIQPQAAPSAPVAQPPMGPAPGQAPLPAPVYGQAPAYGQPLAPYGAPTAPVFRPTIPGQSVLVVDNGGLDLTGALSVEFTLAGKRVLPESVTLAVRNELFDKSRSQLNVSTKADGVLVDFVDDFFEKKEVIPVTFAAKDALGNAYTFSGTVQPETLGVQDVRLGIAVKELDNLNPRSMRVEVRGNNFGGTFAADSPGVSYNPVTGLVLVDVPGAPARLGERINFQVSAEDGSARQFQASGSFVLDFDDRFGATATAAQATGDTLRDFVNAVDAQKNQQDLAYQQNVVQPYLNARNYADQAQRWNDIAQSQYALQNGYLPIYTESAVPAATGPQTAYFQDAAEFAFPSMGEPFADAQALPVSNPFLGQAFPNAAPQAPDSGEQPLETVRAETVFEQEISFKVVRPLVAQSAPVAQNTQADSSFSAPVKVAEQAPVQQTQTARVAMAAVPVQNAATDAVAGFVSFGSSLAAPGRGSLLLVVLALVLVAFIAREAHPARSVAKAAHPRRHGAHASPAMHAILNYKK